MEREKQSSQQQLSSESQINQQSQQQLSEKDLEQQSKQKLHNKQIPFPEYQGSFRIFKNKQRGKQLKSYVKIKSQNHLYKIKTALSLLRNRQIKDADYIDQKKKQKLAVVPVQHYFLFRPASNATIFIHVFRVDTRKCNIRVYNSTGFILAYFTDIRASRKFHKIYKICKKIRKHCLYVINDEMQSIQKQATFIKKLSQFTKDFCYFSRIQPQALPLKFLTLNIQQQNLKEVCKSSYIWVKNDKFYYFSDVFTKKQQNFDFNLGKIQQIQNKVQNQHFNQFLQQIEDTGINFILKSVLINFSKYWDLKSQNQIVDEFHQMLANHQNCSNNKAFMETGNILHHFPQPMKTCKQCVHCSKKYKNKAKKKFIIKTKYRCEGCTAQQNQKKDISLCLQCFQQYHKIKQANKRKINKKSQQVKEKKIQIKSDKKQEKFRQKNNQSNLSLFSIFKSIYNKQRQQMQQNPKPVNNTVQSALNVIQSNINDDLVQNQQSQVQNSLNAIQTGGAQSESTSATFNKQMQLNQNNLVLIINEQIQAQKKKFISIFKGLVKNELTMNYAITVAEFVKFNIAGEQ